MSPSPTTLSTAGLRAERMTLLARYDSGAMSLAVYGVLKSVETDIAWREHRQHQPGVLRRSTRPSRPNATAQ